MNEQEREALRAAAEVALANGYDEAWFTEGSAVYDELEKTDADFIVQASPARILWLLEHLRLPFQPPPKPTGFPLDLVKAGEAVCPKCGFTYTWDPYAGRTKPLECMNCPPEEP